jgi:transcriptional regulator with XRE-family HTH domain
MNYRYDLAQWRRKETSDSYAVLSERCGLSRTTLCDTVRGKNARGVVDPSASTIAKTFKALGLDPKYALDFKLKKAEFRRAVVVTAR